MPASKYLLKAAIWIIILLTLNTVSPTHYSNATAPSQASAAKSALNWLSENANPDGSFGGFAQITSPAAAFALWLNDSRSAQATKSFSWLSSQLDDSSSFAWGEADIPGQILYALSASGNVRLLVNPSDFSALLSYQQDNGGFRGWYDQSGAQTTSSVDTAMALLGLTGTHAISSSELQQASAYLMLLQNHDGSFNLTRTEASNHYETLGPESISTTALAVLALKSASYTASNTSVANALSFLATASSSNFTSSHDNRGHVYAASLSALALNAFGRAAQAEASIAFIISQQDSDGGFRDIGRGSSGSNALDTGWAAIALEQVQPGPLFSSLLSPIVFVGVIILAGVVAVVVVVSAYSLLRRRAIKPT